MLPRVAAVRPPPCSLNAGCAGLCAGARHGVVRGGATATECGVARLLPRVAAVRPPPCSLDAGCAVACGLARATVWCGVWRDCYRGRRLWGRHRARSTRAALACGLARAAVWCEGARVLPETAAVRPPPCSRNAGCAGLLAGARHGVVRGGACAAEGGGCGAATVLAQRGLRWHCTLARATVWCEAARVLPETAARGAVARAAIVLARRGLR